MGLQALARHVEDVQAGPPRGGLQEMAGAAVDIDHVAPLADDHAGGGVVREQQPIYLRVEVRLLRGGSGQGHPHLEVHSAGLRGKPVEGLRGRPGLLAPENLPLLVHDLKQVAEAADGLRGTEEEQAAGLERVVEDGQQPALQVGVEVDEEVAAGDEVQLGEGRVLDDILHGEDGHLADLLADAIHAVAASEVAFQAGPADIAGDAFRVVAITGGLDGFAVQVGAEDLHLAVALRALHGLAQQDGE